MKKTINVLVVFLLLMIPTNGIAKGFEESNIYYFEKISIYVNGQPVDQSVTFSVY